MREPGSILLVACYELGHQPLAVAWPATRLVFPVPSRHALPALTRYAHLEREGAERSPPRASWP